VEHIECHTQVVKEVKRRDEHEKIQAREMAQRPLESGQTDDAIDVEKSGLPMSFFDNPEVLKTVLMTVECGQNYIRTKPGGVNELSHHTFFTTKLIPKLDKMIDDKNIGKMRSMSRELAAVLFSDGWTAVNHHAIVNIIMVVRSQHTLRIC
jgi:hypothetical protein